MWGVRDRTACQALCRYRRPGQSTDTAPRPTLAHCRKVRVGASIQANCAPYSAKAMAMVLPAMAPATPSRTSQFRSCARQPACEPGEPTGRTP